ncbi:MAG TPA: hypothetical protein VGB23_09795 [Nitrospirota bacterium]
MKKADFIACSLAFHAVLLIIAVLMPAPFPSAGYTAANLAYVEVVPGASAPVTDKHDNEDTPSGLPLQNPLDASTLFAGVPGELKLGGRLNSLGGMPSAAKPAGEQYTAGKPAPPPVGQDAGNTTPAPPAKTAAPAPAMSGSRFAPEFTGTSAGAETVAVAAAPKGMTGVVTGRKSINFRYQKGWPTPSMVRLDVDAGGGEWTAEPDSDWIMVSGGAGKGRGGAEVGVMAARLGLGYYEGGVRILTGGSGGEAARVPVTVMVLPREPGTAEMPHSAWDGYMDGGCKVCHLPESVMPSADFMKRSEFCAICHSKNGIAERKVAGRGGHPVMVRAGKGGTRMPSRGTVDTGPYSDRMATHLLDGKVVCVTCHNVMQKPGDYGRTWELASTDDHMTYMLSKGGWQSMGRLVPKVYVTKGLAPMPRLLSGAAPFIAVPSGYVYDETEGSITFDSPAKEGEEVYVTLTNPYLRTTTEQNGICYDCHTQNTHEGLNCLDCHAAHGTANIKAVRQRVRMPGKRPRKVVFTSKTGVGSFADGAGPLDGICEACHTSTKYYKASGGNSVHKGGKDYTGKDCTACHRHSNGFGI